MKPLLSIVIANYNYGRFLEDAIRSVVMQIGDGKDQVCLGEIELIIIDGGSTDNSVEVIQKYASGLPAGIRRDASSVVHLNLPSTPITYWVSEKDNGQSDAFNKGFAQATGRFLTWLNADDLLIFRSLKKVMCEIQSHPGCEWLSGETIYVDADCKVLTTGVRMFNRVGRILCVPAWARITAPSTFFTKELYTRCGRVDEALHYVMDTDLWMRFHAAGARLHYLGDYVWAFRLHERSKTSDSVVSGTRSPRFLEERVLIRRRMGITPLANKMAYLGKRFGCLLSMGNLRRGLFLLKNKGLHISDVKW